MTEPTELTRASDAMARAVANLLPANAPPAIIAEFRIALGDLLAATLGGATVMAAKAVLAVDAKVDRLAAIRGKALQDVQHDLDRVAKRVHLLEDEFLPPGAVGQLQDAVAVLARDVEKLKERAVHGNAE